MGTGTSFRLTAKIGTETIGVVEVDANAEKLKVGNVVAEDVCPANPMVVTPEDDVTVNSRICLNIYFTGLSQLHITHQSITYVQSRNYNIHISLGSSGVAICNSKSLI